jgi:hypothetical protein
VGCAALALLLLGMLWFQEPEPIPASKPLRMTMAAGEVPPPAPVKPPPVVESPPPAPPPSANLAAAQPAPSSEQAEEREADAEDTGRVPERRAPPTLRKRDAGIAPKSITRRNVGKTAGKGISKIQLVATYQGGAVSAPVEIDGVWRGNTPLTVTLKGGSHAIRIDHGRTRVNQFVTHVDGGRSVNLQVDLRPASEWRGNGPSKHGKRHRH